MRQKHTFVVCLDVAQVVAPTVVGFTDTHRIMSEVDVAVIAEECEKLAKVQGYGGYIRIFWHLGGFAVVY